MKRFVFSRSDNFENHQNGNWNEIFEETLDDHSDKQDTCSVPAKTITFSQPLKARFVKLDVLDYYGDGAALQYIKIE